MSLRHPASNIACSTAVGLGRERCILDGVSIHIGCCNMYVRRCLHPTSFLLLVWVLEARGVSSRMHPYKSGVGRCIFDELSIHIGCWKMYVCRCIYRISRLLLDTSTDIHLPTPDMYRSNISSSIFYCIYRIDVSIEYLVFYLLP